MEKIRVLPAKVRTMLFVALMSTAISLAPALAHLFELPNKIGLDRDSYFTVQGIYRGWNLFAIVLLIQFISIGSLMLSSRRFRRLRWPSVMAMAGLIGAQALFWSFTFPANRATTNWTTKPDNWEALRAQWEYSHAGGAVLQLTVFVALAVAALRRPAVSPSQYPTTVSRSTR